MTITAQSLPFKEQIDFFRQKVNIPTEVWNEMVHQNHDRAFVVAGATKADMLNDFRAAVDAAISEGKSVGWFRKEFDNIVAKYGWAYHGERNWRSKVIYTTNLSTSYAAGRFQQLTSPQMLKARPYWQYIHSDLSVHPRPLHVSWNGLTLKHDDPWWNTHFPPNGWGCRCRIKAVSKQTADSSEKTTPANDGSFEFIDAQGIAHTTPNGIDAGFGYTPGRTWLPDLKDVPREISKQVIQSYLSEGVFIRWLSRIEKQVQEFIQGDRSSSLSTKNLKSGARSTLDTGESFPVAAFSDAAMSLTESKTPIITFSGYDMIKQVISRANQSFGPEEYALIQRIIDNPKLVIAQHEEGSPKSFLFASDQEGERVAVIRLTKSGQGAFLKSYRRGSIRAERRRAENSHRSEILLDLTLD